MKNFSKLKRSLLRDEDKACSSRVAATDELFDLFIVRQNLLDAMGFTPKQDYLNLLDSRIKALLDVVGCCQHSALACTDCK